MVNSIVLLAKQSGKTSFSTLWQVKNALGTKKVGHTGTLDNFADGLLVLLTGSLTRLGNYITACDKQYLARITFGNRTDTLDPSGTIIETAPLPDISRIQSALPSFTGTINQIPPEYSAIHVEGQRASDLVRKGETVTLTSRNVTIYNLELVATYGPDGAKNPQTGPVSFADINVHCSKGTYIRSLARDIGKAVDSCAHTSALRRTAVGPFCLNDAAGFSYLPEFGVAADSEKVIPVPPESIITACTPFTRKLAELTGLFCIDLENGFHNSFMNGKKMNRDWFIHPLLENTQYAVFNGESFCGIVHLQGGKPVYDFVYREQP